MDTFTSLFNLIATGSHSNSILDTDYALLDKEWNKFVTLEAELWKEFHEYWVNQDIPVHIIRYEDILTDPEPVLKACLEFVLNVDDITGTKVHEYLKVAV